jgi:hypothetical protein
MVRYLTFSYLDGIPKGIAQRVRCLLNPPECIVNHNDIAIVPKNSFSDKESQIKILILAERNELFSDFGVRDFCSEITIAGWLYNSFENKMLKDPEYDKKRAGFHDMFVILDEITFSRNFGLGIFNELPNTEIIFDSKLPDLNARGNNSSAHSQPLYESYKTKISSLLKFYEDGIIEKLHKLLKGRDLIKYCNSEFMFANNNVYQCYPMVNFNFSLKNYEDFYNKELALVFRDLSFDLNALKRAFVKNNYLLYLSKWMSKEVRDRKQDLFVSVGNAINKFYELSDELCKRHDNFDAMFHLFLYLMKSINQKIVDSFDDKACVLYYGDLKRELINNKIVQNEFSKVYNKFSLNLLNTNYPEDEFANENEVLRSFFFSVKTLIGEGQQHQKNDLFAISRLLFEMNYDWMREISAESEKFVFDNACTYYSKSTQYQVETKNYKGVLQIIKYANNHKYVCDFIKDYDISKTSKITLWRRIIDYILEVYDTEYVSGDSYDVTSKRIVILYDSFYLYFTVNDQIKLKLYYKIVFPSIDVAVLCLSCYVFNIERIW